MIANKFNFARKEKNNYVAGLDSQRYELKSFKTGPSR